MLKELVFTRKHRGEVYKFYIVRPEFEGEVGCLGIKVDPYVMVETPENDFGYTDTILLSNHTRTAYTLHRYLQPNVLKAIEKQMLNLLKKYIEA